jgi:hypothetical protein
VAVALAVVERQLLEVTMVEHMVAEVLDILQAQQIIMVVVAQFVSYGEMADLFHQLIPVIFNV